MNAKRRISLILAALLLCAVLSVPASAGDAEPDGVNASNYFTQHSAKLKPGAAAGKLNLTYFMTTVTTMTTLGVFKIQLRNADGTVYWNVWGSTANGLLVTNAASHYGTYSLNAVSGNTYYCVVTVTARNAAGSDTRTITTGSVTCP